MSKRQSNFPDPRQHIDPGFFERKKPPPFKVKSFVYDKEDGKFLGRDGESWCKYK